MRKILFVGCYFISTLFTPIFSQEIQPTRPKDFKPFIYKYSIEELSKMYSSEQMRKARVAEKDMKDLINKSPYKPDFSKIDKHRLPEWFKDAKFGIFLDWGLWSPAGYGARGYHGNYYPDTYLGYMYENPKVVEYHKKYWGADFERDDFIPLFKANKFNSDTFALQCKKWGAKYVIPFAKHMDGYCIWNNSYSHRDAVDMPPYRDLLGEMYGAFQKQGLKYGFYNCNYEFEYPIINNNSILLRTTKAANDPKDDMSGYLKFDSKKHNRMISGKIAVNNYINDYYVPYMKEVIDKYNPDILWYDAEWFNTSKNNGNDIITSYFYNKNEGKKEVAVNDRLGTDSREKHGDFYTSEFHVIIENKEHYWEENRPLGGSYGYYWADNDSTMLSPSELIKMLVRIVARNGNLMLMVCPDGEGNIPQNQISRFNEMGDWLKTNGEAIYGTRATKESSDPSNTGDNVWYTTTKDGKYTYAFLFEWPKTGNITLRMAHPKWETKAYLLGYNKPLLSYDNPVDGMYVEFPEEMKNPSKRPAKHVWVVKYENW